MSSVTRPRGPLPARIYWTRRLLALGLALGLVFGVGQLLDRGGQQPGTPSARPAAGVASEPAPSGGTPSPSALPTEGAGDPRAKEGKKERKEDDRKAERTRTPLAVPTGPCADSDVRVVPSVDGDAFAVHDVVLTLNLSTVKSPACTWEVSAESVVLRLTSGSDRIWTTQQCEDAVPDRSVVLRKDSTRKVDVTWSGQRSDDGCTQAPLWAEPGYYHVSAAAVGAEPESHQFELREKVTQTVTAKPEPRRKSEEKAEREQDPGEQRG